MDGADACSLLPAVAAAADVLAGDSCCARCAPAAGMEDGERPWLKPHVHTPAARDPEPGATRKRPLIYVYELPAIYNSVMLQVRAQGL